jgi:hypothetical protein
MNHPDARFLIESERRRGEMALAAQHLMVKEAQRAGMKIPPLLSLSNVNISPLTLALAHGLDWLGHLFAVWSCRLQTRYASVPLEAPLESQSGPCSS